MLDLLTRLRMSSRAEELALVSGGYRAEVERMQRGVLDYLTQPAQAISEGRLSAGLKERRTIRCSMRPPQGRFGQSS